MDKTWIEDILKIAINLEWLGVRFEDTKDVKGKFGLPKTAYYYSVPEQNDRWNASGVFYQVRHHHK